MVPVIVIPIVLTTKKVTTSFESGIITCSPPPPNANCYQAATKNNPGLPMTVSVNITNPNYRPASSRWILFVYDQLGQPISPFAGTISNWTTIPAHGTASVVGTILLLNNNPGGAQDFFEKMIYNSSSGNGSPVTSTYNLTLGGHIDTQVGSISDQVVNVPNWTFVPTFAA